MTASSYRAAKLLTDLFGPSVAITPDFPAMLEMVEAALAEERGAVRCAECLASSRVVRFFRAVGQAHGMGC